VGGAVTITAGRLGDSGQYQKSEGYRYVEQASLSPQELKHLEDTNLPLPPIPAAMREQTDIK
jgi:hypothetical protein